MNARAVQAARVRRVVAAHLLVVVERLSREVDVHRDVVRGGAGELHGAAVHGDRSHRRRAGKEHEKLPLRPHLAPHPAQPQHSAVERRAAGGAEEDRPAHGRRRLHPEHERGAAVHLHGEAVAAAPVARVGLRQQPPGVGLDLSDAVRSPAAEPDGGVERHLGRQAAAVRVEEEEIAAVADDRGGAVDLPDRRLAEDGAGVAQELAVRLRPLQPAAEPRRVLGGEGAELGGVARGDHVDHVVPAAPRRWRRARE